MYATCMQTGICKHPQKTSSRTHEEYFGNNQFGDYPVINITWEDARIYCEWVGGQLPSEAEWERAARGSETRLYPWGNETGGSEYANYGNRSSDTTPAGSFPQGASPFGALDMLGNVWEWVEDWHQADV